MLLLLRRTITTLTVVQLIANTVLFPTSRLFVAPEKSYYIFCISICAERTTTRLRHLVVDLQPNPVAFFFCWAALVPTSGQNKGSHSVYLLVSSYLLHVSFKFYIPFHIKQLLFFKTVLSVDGSH